MSWSGREALPNVWELSGGPHGCPGVVKRPSWMSWSGRETLLVVREWWEALPYVRELSGDPPECPCGMGGYSGCPAVVGMPSRMSGRPR